MKKKYLTNGKQKLNKSITVKRKANFFCKTGKEAVASVQASMKEGD